MPAPPPPPKQPSSLSPQELCEKPPPDRAVCVACGMQGRTSLETSGECGGGRGEEKNREEEFFSSCKKKSIIGKLYIHSVVALGVPQIEQPQVFSVLCKL